MSLYVKKQGETLIKYILSYLILHTVFNDDHNNC